jgi:hypothetical protein
MLSSGYGAKLCRAYFSIKALGTDAGKISGSFSSAFRGSRKSISFFFFFFIPSVFIGFYSKGW